MDARTPRRTHAKLTPHVAARPEGGFVLVPAWAFVGAWWALRTRELRPVDLRVWLASFEAVARRCGARKGCRAAYSTGELRTLVAAGSDRTVRESLKRLGRVGLLAWRGDGPGHAARVEEVVLARPGPMLNALGKVAMPARRVPVPRRLVRELCRATSATLLATAFGHLVRCLFNRRRSCASGGLCKASWIAEVFGISTRSVKRCRARLVAWGLLATEHAPQRVMNRHGGWSAWNLRWKASGRPGSAKACGVVSGAALSPPVAVSRRRLSPPKETSNSLSGSEHQQPGGGRGVPRRVCVRSGDGARVSRGVKPEEGADTPRTLGSLGHVRPEELAKVSGLVRVYRRATAAGLVSRSEAGVLRLVAAASHARRVACRNPAGLFATVVRRGLWSFIAGEDEDRARAAARAVWGVVRSRMPSRAPTKSERNREAGCDGPELPPEEVRRLVMESLAASETLVRPPHLIRNSNAVPDRCS